MLPVFLAIEGLYAFQERQEIDFTRLCDAGLFGIFGKVGSGKSSILEAISFVLYGETNRLNRNGRTYNMLNLSSDKLFIEFHFISRDQKKYAFEVSWKRSSKNYNNIGTPQRRAFVFGADGQKQPIDGTDAAAILGMSYENFSRTVIIPQGQFKEFLELKGSDRSEMMKQLFQLDQYDLSEKLRILRAETDNKYIEIQTLLNTYSEYTPEGKQEVEDSVALREKATTDLKAERDRLTAHFLQIQKLKEAYGHFLLKQKSFETLCVQAPQIKQLKEELAQFLQVERSFLHLIQMVEDAESVLEQKTTTVSQAEKEVDAVKARLQHVNGQIASVQPEAEAEVAMEAQLQALQNLLELKGINKEIATLEERIDNGNIFVQEQEKQAIREKEQIAEKRKGLIVQKEQIISGNILLDAQEWFSSVKQIRINLDRCLQNKLQQEEEAQKRSRELQAEAQGAASWQAVVERKIVMIAADLEQARAEHTALKVKEQLGVYISHLQDGSPCPLCGALEHPHVLQAEDISPVLAASTREIARLEEEKSRMEKRQQELSQAEKDYRNLTKEITLLQEEQNMLEAQLAAKDALFAWKHLFSKDELAFKQVREKQHALDLKIKQEENELEHLEKQAEKTVERYEKARQRIVELRQEIALQEGIKQSKSGTLGLIDPGFTDYTEEQLSSYIQNARKRLQYVLEQHRTLLTQKQGLETRLAAQEATIATLNKELQALQDKYREQLALLNQNLAAQQFKSREEPKDILQKKLDTAALQAQVQDFELRYTGLQKELELLTQDTSLQTYKEEQFNEAQQALQFKEKEWQESIGVLTSLKDKQELFTAKLREKARLALDYEQVQQRREHLRTLGNMFNGNGFVNFVSTQYLQDLCDIANLRFSRLTRGQLELVINESNEFDVIDHLHSGNRRSVRTLSGGQLFQASLCLALALAESTRSLNQMEKNFFFIDEGFGTQDQDAINTIFETLRNLRDENRIVGIISHVEELKERIPVAVMVEKHAERGSIIN